MDANTALVVVAVITVAGTLGGLVIGALVEGRHRHDEEKRRVYGRLIGVVRERLWEIEHIRELDPVPTEIRDRYLEQIADLVSIVQLIGGSKVTKAARTVHKAMMAMFSWTPPDSAPDGDVLASWQAQETATDDGLKGFIVAAQADMHLGRHWWNRG